MLRPATPLSIAFLIAFVLLLLATLSTPIIKSIPLGQNNGFNFGVFGYCNTNTNTCGSLTVGYPPREINAPSQQDYNLGSGARATLSYILIVHPIAAFMVLICLILAIAAHFRKPAHSPRFLLILLIFTFPTMIVTLLAFLVDILLFIPHPQWGTWIVLPAALIVIVCSVLTCAMRRTLVSRKARKKRIAENPDMNGSEYYAMKSDMQMRPPEQQYARAESPPPIANGQPNGIATYDKAAGYAAYPTRSQEEDRVPLNARDPSMRSTSTHGARDMSGSTAVGRSSSRTRDDDPIDGRSPIDGAPRLSSESRRMRGGPMYNRGGPAPGFYGRGRGGYPPRGAYGPGKGGYPPRGGPRGGFRGGPGPYGAPRGGPMMRGRAPPPPGYGGYYRSPSGSRDEYGPPPMTYDGQGLPQDRQWLEQDPYGYEQQQPSGMPVDGGYARSAGASPAGSRSGSRRPSQSTRDPASFGFSGRMPSPARSQSAPRDPEPAPPVPAIPSNLPNHGVVDDRNGYMPPADEIVGPVHSGPYDPNQEHQHQPIEIGNTSPQEQRNNAPFAAHDDTLEARPNTTEPQPRKSSDFYEDIDPRFSEDAAPPVPSNPTVTGTANPSNSMPNALMPGYGTQQQYQEPQDRSSSSYDYAPQQQQNAYAPQQQHDYPIQSPYAQTTQQDDYYPPSQQQHPNQNDYPHQQMSYSPAPQQQNHDYLSPTDPNAIPHSRSDSRSPAHSDNSNFTSISQRGINPDWRPGPGPGQSPAGLMSPQDLRGGGGGHGRGAPPASSRRNDQILAANPDFVIPGAGPRSKNHIRGLSREGGGRYPGA